MNEEQLKAQYEQEMALYDQYLKETGGAQVSPAAVPQLDENYLQEVHPEVSTADRLIAKNFSKDEDTTMQFLKTRYPNMDIEKKAGQIWLKNRGEKQFRAFDPEGWGQYTTSPMEALRDIGDVGTDVAMGVGEAAAAAAAGVAAAPTVAGAIPAAMAAGGGAGAGLEYLRQKAGQILGLPQTEVSGTDLLLAGGSGAVSPLLFGTGGVVKNAGKGATKEALQASQRGVLKRGYDVATEKVFPKAAEMFSGVPASATKTLAKNMDTIDELGNDGVLGYAENIHENLVENLSKIKTQTGQRLEKAIADAGESVDISKVKNNFRTTIADLEANAPKNQESSRLIQSLKDKYDELFTQEVPAMGVGIDGGLDTQIMKKELPDKLPASQAFSLQDQLRDAAELFRVKDGPAPRFGASASRADKRGMEAARKGYTELNKEFERVTGGLSQELKNEYANLSSLQKNLQPYFKDASTTFNTLSGLGKKNRKPLYETLERLQKSYGIDLVKPAKELEAFSYYGNPGLDAISSGGVTSTSRSIPLAIAGGAAGSYAGRETGGTPGQIVGSGLGFLLGGKMASPSVIKALVRGGKAVESKTINKLPNAKRANQAANSAWLMMDERE